MTDRPVIMNAPMVRALLGGTKTQARYPAHGPSLWQTLVQPGDRLWIRETWAQTTNVNNQRNWPNRPHLFTDPDSKFECVIWRADGEWEWCDADGWETDKSYWFPSIHMPRWASRLTLEVTEVRRQRLQEISEEDALAEGIYRQDPSPEEISAGICTKDDFVFIAPGTRKGFGPRRDDPQWGPTAVFAYRCLWNCLHGNGAWDENPEVVALSFRTVKENIDQISKEQS